MSLYIRVSYEREDELNAITDRLKDLDMRVETAPQNGRYKRAYLKDKTVKRRQNPFNDIPRIEDEYPIR